MLILACDTSSTACSVCVSEDGVPLASAFLNMGKTHAETFMPMVDDLLKRVKIDYKQIDVFSCTVGPGSFTGIRIGVSAIQTMAMLFDKPAIPVSSMEALAYPHYLRENTLVVPIVDARNRRVFTSVYQDGEQCLEELACTWDELSQTLGQILEDRGCGQILFCGDATHIYAPEAVEMGLPVLDEGRRIVDIHSEVVSTLAYRNYMRVPPEQRAEVFAAGKLVPTYCATTQAERNRDSAGRNETHIKG